MAVFRAPGAAWIIRQRAKTEPVIEGLWFPPRETSAKTIPGFPGGGLAWWGGRRTGGLPSVVTLSSFLAAHPRYVGAEPASPVPNFWVAAQFAGAGSEGPNEISFIVAVGPCKSRGNPVQFIT